MVLLAIVAISGCCFDLTHVSYKPTVMTFDNKPISSLVMKQNVDIPLKSWSVTRIKGGTMWHYVGTVPAGDVYSTDDQVVTAVGSNTHEANIVISENNIVGLYLPVEDGFVAISKPVKFYYEEVSK